MRNHIPILAILVTLLLIPTSTGVYVTDGVLVIHRSQFLVEDEFMAINGILAEDIWDTAGSVTITYQTGDTDITLNIYFANSESWLYFAIVGTDLPDDGNDSLLVTFDVEGDGELNPPEDGFRITGSSSGIADVHWNGEAWVTDEIDGDESDDFSLGFSTRDNKRTYEMAKTLVADNIGYDGFRIANPSNTYIAFNVHYRETLDANGTAMDFYYPTLPSNGSGYVDLKLAGPEDQDLPEFIPPTTVVTTTSTDDGSQGQSPPVTDVVNTIAGDANARFMSIFGLIALVGLYLGRRRVTS